jgi:SpoVK/Ycf46/Vps4 family AAA+-type ATPase
MERLSHALALQAFEKNVIISMIGAAIAPSVVNFQGIRMGAGAVGSTRCTVNDLLNCFCGSLEEQIKSRKYFYKSAILVKEGILNLHGTDFAGDLTECTVEIDRRMLDFVVGLDTEFSEIVDGSHLYSPSVDFEDVILPEETKQLLLQTVENFDTYKLVQKNLEVDKKIAYGRGMALLFYGSSGTGKTMTANALATKLGKKVLLINFPYLGNNEAGQIIKLIFREAKIHDAILFFDECESIFQSRDKGSNRVNMILTELERHDGLSILATNRPYDLDEAMYRRINLAVEFRKPDHILRERIWHALKPEKLQLADDVLIAELAMKYELTGGFIKNTWLGALSLAVSRDGINPVISHEDLKQGAAHQLRGRLGMIDFDRRVVPTRGLEDVVLPDNLKSSLTEIVEYGKAQAILFGQWGFQKQHGTSKGIAALFHGPPGTGKTMAAEAIGYDLGKPLKVVNCAQLISKWVGESQKNIEAVFDEARQVDAVVVFDEAEGLFGSRADTGGDGAGRHDSMNVGILLHHIETFPGVVVVITNMRERIDPAFFRRFKFVMEFPVPDAEHRKKLWRLLLPTEAPLAADVDLDVLANRYVIAGGNIKSVVFRAASRAALRKDAASRVITMADLTSACDEEMQKETGTSTAHLSMYN